MDDLACTTGELIHQGFPIGDGSLSNTMAHVSHNDYYTQQSPISQIVFSPSITPRHGLVYSLSPSQLSRFSTVQQQKAEFQPDAAGLTPHMSIAYPHQSEEMSRETSRVSFQSSMSSGPRYNSGQQTQVYHTDLVPTTTDMRRTVSMYTNMSALQHQYFGSHLLQHQMYADQFDLDLDDMYTSKFSVTLQHSLHNAPLDDSVIDFQPQNTTSLDLLEFGIGVFGQPARQPTYPADVTPQLSPHAKSDGHPMQRPAHSTLLSIPHISTTADPTVSCGSTALPSSPPAEQTKRRRRARSPQSDSEPEVITGHVLASGKFKCSDPKCDDLRFGRQADFRRHHINVHDSNKKEYFCTVKGCDRSKRPEKRSKGRSFGARKDKMEEHVHTVHLKESKKRKRYPETDLEEKEDYDSEEPQSKASR